MAHIDNNYWYITGHDGYVYYSRTGELVAADDTAFTQWVTENGTPLTVTADHLDQTLEKYGLPPTGLVLSTQKSLLLVAASDTLSNLIYQVMPTEAQQVAYLSLVSIVTSAGDIPPASGTVLTKFTSLATAYGIIPSALATIVVALRNVIIDCATAEISLQAAILAATQSSDLTTALAAFETAIGDIVTEANSVTLPVPIVAPPTITVKGI